MKSHNKAALRTARVLLDSAVRLDVLNGTALDLHRLSNALMELPHCRCGKSASINAQVLESISGCFQEAFTVFALRQLAGLNLLHLLPEICLEFLELVNHKQNRLRVTVASANRLTPDQRLGLMANLSEKFGKVIIPEWRTDPSLTAGFIYRTENFIGDYSAKGMLERLKSSLRKDAYAAAGG